jgi:hypothetical protein
MNIDDQSLQLRVENMVEKVPSSCFMIYPLVSY